MMVTGELNMASVTFQEEINTLQTIMDFVTHHNYELVMEVHDLKQRLTEVELVKKSLELSIYTDEIRVSEDAPWFESCLKIVQDAYTMLDYPQIYSTSCSTACISSVKGKIINIVSSDPKDVMGFTHNVTMFIIFAVSNKKSDAQKLLKKCKEVGRITIHILKAWNAQKNANEYIKRLINTVNHIESVVAMEENGSLNVNGNVDIELLKNTGEKFDDEAVIVDLMNNVWSLTGRRLFKRELPNEFINELENITKRLKLEGGVFETTVTIKIKRPYPFGTVSRGPKRGYFGITSLKMISSPSRKILVPISVMT